MTISIQNKVLNFVKRNDSNPTNDTPEVIDDQDINQQFVDSYLEEVFGQTRVDAQTFHFANHCLFPFIPFSTRNTFTQLLRKNCGAYVDSAYCDNEKWVIQPQPLPICNPKDKNYNSCIEDVMYYRSTIEFQNPNSIPSISKKEHPEIYRNITWMINATRQLGYNDFSRHLHHLLKSGQLKYQESQQSGFAFADRLNPGVIIFSPPFFEQKWRDVKRMMNKGPTE